MALDFTKADQGITQIPFKGKKYGLDTAGNLFVDGKPQTVPAAEWNEFLEAYDKKFMEFASKKTTDATHIGLARDTLAAVASKNDHLPYIEDSHNLLQGVNALEAEIQAIPGGEVANETALRNLKKIQIANPLATNIIHADTHNRIYMDEVVDAKGIKTRVIDSTKLDKELSDLRSGTDKLAKLYEKGGYVEKDVERVFLSHHPDLPHVLPTEISDAFKGGKDAAHGVPLSPKLDAASVGTKALGVAEGHAKDVFAKAKSILAIQKQLDRNPPLWIKSKLEKDLAKATTEFGTLSAQYPDSARVIQDTLKRDLTESQFTKLTSLPKVNTTLGSLGKAAESAGAPAAKDAAKKGGGLLGIFKHTEESVAKAIEKNPNAKAEIGKIRPGRVGAAVVAGLGLTYLGVKAFSGKSANDNQPNFAEREDARRAAQPAGHAMGA